MNLLNTIKGLYEKVDPQDTGGAEETSMIMGQLKQIKHYIEGIEKTVAKDGDVEEWVQNKLTKATDYLKSVYGYKLGQDDSEEMDEEVELEEAGLPPHLAKLFDKDGNFKDPKKQKIFNRMMGDGIGKEIAQKMGRIKFRVDADNAKKTVKVYVDSNDEKDAQKALKMHPAYISGNMRVIPEEVDLNEELKLTEEIEMAIEEGKRFGLTQSLLDAVKNVLAAETKPEDKLDPVNKKAVKKDFDDRKDKDIDNDGDVDDSDEYLHNRRKAVSKAVTKEQDDGDDVNINVNVDKEDDDEDEKKEKKAKKDVDNGDKSDEKKAMAKNTDDDDEMSDEEKQKEKEYIAKKSDRKEPVDTKPTVKESLARKRLSGMMRDKANVKNVRIPTPAERRAQMQKQQQQKKEEVELDEVDMGQAERGMRGQSKPTGLGYRVVNMKTRKTISTHDSQSDAMRVATRNDDYKVERIKEEVIVKEVHIKEAEMTPEQEKKREEIVMALKKKMPEFEAKYGDRAKEVMYATATKLAMKD